MENEVKISADEVAQEFVSAKTLQNLEGLKLVLATTRKGVTLNIEIPWQGLKTLIIAGCIIWTSIAAGIPAVRTFIGKIPN